MKVGRVGVTLGMMIDDVPVSHLVQQRMLLSEYSTK